MLSNCLLGDVELTKHFDSNKYRCSGYSTGFDSSTYFLWKDGSPGKNVIMFTADRSYSTHIDNKNKDILVLDDVWQKD